VAKGHRFFCCVGLRPHFFLETHFLASHPFLVHIAPWVANERFVQHKTEISNDELNSMVESTMPEILDTLSPLADVVTRLKAQEILCLGHNRLYELLRSGELQAYKDGAKTLVTIESIRRYRAKRPRAIFKPPVPRKNNFETLDRTAPRRRRRRKAVAG
jgi:hypothetical protein